MILNKAKNKNLCKLSLSDFLFIRPCKMFFFSSDKTFSSVKYKIAELCMVHITKFNLNWNEAKLTWVPHKSHEPV